MCPGFGFWEKSLNRIGSWNLVIAAYTVTVIETRIFIMEGDAIDQKTLYLIKAYLKNAFKIIGIRCSCPKLKTSCTIIFPAEPIKDFLEAI